ncbi:MAG: DUF3097 family protein [Nitriliruptoraceae bacterium]
MAAREGFELRDERGVLAGASGRRTIPRRAASPGLLVEVASGSFVGAVVSCDAERVVLEDRRGRRRSFTLGPGAFLVDDVAVELVPVAEEPAAAPDPLGVTASGSVPSSDTRAKVARASRILVEGVHDAVLLERVWGDDLRAEGIVVEVLDGADDLAAVVEAFGPSPQRRLGILLDHLVDGSKEQRLAASVRHPDVLVTGHPFVDVWTAIRPQVLGLTSWPEVPRGEEYKAGLARRLGYAEHRDLWAALQARVSSWRDLEPSLIGAVERLLDFVTEADEARP